MRRFVLILCVLGFALLSMGSIISIKAFSEITISCEGSIVVPQQAPQQVLQQAPYPIALNVIGGLTILASAGFFAAALLYNRHMH